MELKQAKSGKALSINITSVPILQSVINPQLFRYGALLYFRPECGSEYAFANIVYSCHVLSVPEKLIRDLICALSIHT